MGLLDGKVALVTGAGSGIGEATARKLAAEGAAVCVVDVAPSGKTVADELASAGVGAVFVQGDVADPAFDADAVATCERQLGGLDIACLNAGVVTGEGDLAALTDEQYRRVVGVNLDGVVFGMRAAIPALERRGGGDLVATASLAGIVPFPPDPVYTLTKHGVVGFVRSLAPQLAGRNIRVNCVCPGIVRTPLVGEEAAQRLSEAGFPLLQPDDIAAAVLHILSGGGTGEAWACQPGRPPVAYRFGGAPGPRTPGAQGMRPPDIAAGP